MGNKFCGIIFKNNINFDKNSFDYEISKSIINKQLKILIKKGYNNFYIIYDNNNLNLLCLELIKQIKNDINIFIFLPYKILETKPNLDWCKQIIKIKSKPILKIYNKIEKHMIKRCNMLLSEKINNQTFVNQKNINKNGKDIIFVDFSQF